VARKIQIFGTELSEDQLRILAYLANTGVPVPTTQIFKDMDMGMRSFYPSIQALRRSGLVDWVSEGKLSERKVTMACKDPGQVKGWLRANRPDLLKGS